MSISVIIPAYKARKYLAEALESIGKQTLPAAEVIVVDDKSPDPVDDIIDDFAKRPGYPPLRLIKHKENRGQAAARNTGMHASSSEWIAFIDSDDIWAPSHLESVMDTIQKAGSDIGFCSCVMFDKDKHDPSNYLLCPLTDDEKKIRPLSILKRCFIVTSSTIVRADSFRKVGGYDESMELHNGAEDVDLFMRLLKEGARFVMAPETTLYYRKHPDSATCTVGCVSRQDVFAKNRHIHWPEGSRHEKKTILMEGYWRSATQLWLIKAPDRISWVMDALRHSLWNPYQCLRWTCRFLRALYRNSNRGL